MPCGQRAVAVGDVAGLSNSTMLHLFEYVNPIQNRNDHFEQYLKTKYPSCPYEP